MAFDSYIKMILPPTSNHVPTILVLMLARSSNQVPYTSRVEDFSSMLNLDRAFLYFPNLSEEKRGEERRDGVYSSGEAHL